MTPEEKLERMARAAYLAERPTDYNEPYTEVEASYFEMLIQAALRELVKMAERDAETFQEIVEGIGLAVLDILEVEL